MKENKPVVITHAEAMGSRVDDLVQRQNSMRGEAKGQGRALRAWYYQNWFVFMVAGFLAAMLAWSVVEPWFDDYPYTQAQITAVEGSDGALPAVVTLSTAEQILVMEKTELLIGEKTALVSFSDLTVGKEVGFYVTEDIDSHVAAYIDPTPPEQSKPETLESQTWKSLLGSLLLFPLVASLIGLFIGAADGIVCKLPSRAVRCGLVGFTIGGVGGVFAEVAAAMVYAPLSTYAFSHEGGAVAGLTLTGFVIQTTGRGFAWALAGCCMGLGQGVALRSKKLAVYGLLGGVMGGLMGGLLFDPVDFLLLNPQGSVSAHISRAVGLGVIGLTVGAMIGVVELLSRDSWLQMIDGPLTGKEFLIHKDMMVVGSAPACDIYLFNDEKVEGRHAFLRCVGEQVEIESASKDNPVLVNERPITSTRLRSGDQVAVGRTVFVYHQKRK